MSKSVKTSRIDEIDMLPPEQTLTPAEVAAWIGANRNTCKGWLDSHPDLFPCASRNEDNGYRAYDANALRRLCIFQALRSRPHPKLNIADVRQVFQIVRIEDLWAAFRKSNDELKRIAADVLN